MVTLQGVGEALAVRQQKVEDAIPICMFFLNAEKTSSTSERLFSQNPPILPQVAMVGRWGSPRSALVGCQGDPCLPIAIPQPWRITLPLVFKQHSGICLFLGDNLIPFMDLFWAITWLYFKASY